ncbi:MAG: MarR family transcriptional regulator [Henriciella sp.]
MSDMVKEKTGQGRGIPELDGSTPILSFLLLRAFFWSDRSLQASLEARGWPPLSRAESQVMLLVSAGITRPSKVAKQLGVTRQAINLTLNLLRERQLIEIIPDPDDKRCKRIIFPEGGTDIRNEALEILVKIERELIDRIGRKTVLDLREALDRNWGEIAVFDRTEDAGPR